MAGARCLKLARCMNETVSSEKKKKTTIEYTHRNQISTETIQFGLLYTHTI